MTTSPVKGAQHVNFKPEDIARAEGKHKDYPKTPIPEKQHVHFNSKDIARVEGKEHKNFPKTLFAEPPHVQFKPEDIARVEGNEHRDYPKTHLPVGKPHVRFNDEAMKRKENKEHVDFPKTHKKRSDNPGKPGRVKIATKDFLLHLKLMVGFSCLFAFGTWKTAGDPYAYLKETKPKSLQEIYQDQIDKRIQLVKPELPYGGGLQLPAEGINSDGCELFLTESSIPNSGFGVFTTRAFEDGDIIFGQSIDLSVNGVDVPIHAMLLKQHPYFGNAKSTKNGIIAKRNIEVGEELFIDLNDMDQKFADIYYSVLHPLDPLNDDYEKADKIVRDIMDAIPLTTVFEKPRKKNYKKRTERKTKQVPSVDAGSIFTVVRDSLKEYNPKLVDLVPDTTAWARSILDAEGTAQFISNHRSVEWLTNYGICFGGLSSQSSCPTKQAMMEQDGGKGAFATRDVAAGDVIATTPLYAVPIANVPADGNCIAAPVAGVFFCPLSFASNIQKGSDCEIGAKECSSKGSNAKYQWSEYNSANQSLKNLSAEDLLKVRFY
jgi:predicted RecA/RadA family phage recombinase